MDAFTAYFIWVLIIALGFGAITAKVADDRGIYGGPVFWFLAGFLLFIIALPLAFLIPPDAKTIELKKLQSGDGKKCPRCAETVKADAVICRYCQADLRSRSATNYGQVSRRY